jgi:hypothetical protein
MRSGTQRFSNFLSRPPQMDGEGGCRGAQLAGMHVAVNKGLTATLSGFANILWQWCSQCEACDRGATIRHTNESGWLEESCLHSTGWTAQVHKDALVEWLVDLFGQASNATEHQHDILGPPELASAFNSIARHHVPRPPAKPDLLSMCESLPSTVEIPAESDVGGLK